MVQWVVSSQRVPNWETHSEVQSMEADSHLVWEVVLLELSGPGSEMDQVTYLEQN